MLRITKDAAIFHLQCSTQPSTCFLEREALLEQKHEKVSLTGINHGLFSLSEMGAMKPHWRLKFRSEGSISATATSIDQRPSSFQV
jgi:hypothetical protein